MSQNLKKHNHYVPEMYLENWALDKRINVYNLIVPHENYPVWKNNSISYSASIDYLYVRHTNGKEIDDLENLFMSKYETPAKLPLMKACEGKRMTPEDWRILINFMAAQVVRTPAFFFKHQDIMNRIIQSAVENVGNIISNLTSEQLKERQHFQESTNDFLIPLKLRFLEKETADTHQNVEIETVVGKSTWFFIIQHLLSLLPNVLWNNKWSILQTSEGVFLPTTDDPVVFLTTDANGNYCFDGKWDQPDCEIIFPICPQKAIYTRVGHKNPPRITLSIEESIKLKSLIVRHALMYIYSLNQDECIPKERTRIVNFVGIGLI